VKQANSVAAAAATVANAGDRVVGEIRPQHVSHRLRIENAARRDQRTQLSGGLRQPEAFGTAVHGSRDQEACDPHSDGEPRVGAPAGARRAGQARPPDRSLHGVADPAPVFTAEGIRILASPPQAPRADAICERIIGTLRQELLDRLLIVNEHHLRQLLTEYLQHYNTARPHCFLGQLTPAQAGIQPPEPDQPRRPPDPP
jgi:hypothetical protein